VVADPLSARRLIGLAGQFAAVDNELTGRENVEMIGRLYRLSPAQARQRAGEVLERFGLADVADRRVSTYSGGMRRRLDLGARWSAARRWCCSTSRARGWIPAPARSCGTRSTSCAAPEPRCC